MDMRSEREKLLEQAVRKAAYRYQVERVVKDFDYLFRRSVPWRKTIDRLELEHSVTFARIRAEFARLNSQAGAA